VSRPRSWVSCTLGGPTNRLLPTALGALGFERADMNAGCRVKEMNARCCGIAGTCGLKAEKYEIAMAAGRELFDQVAASGATAVACDSETCRWQIAKATERPSVHPIDYLHRAYGLDTPQL
jgi:glycerol-3-phosphate dehydrogenase subunit C